MTVPFATLTVLEPSAKERDYRSILSVIARFDRPIGTAELGKYRRRWLDYPPRNPLPGYRNRLEEVLANIVKDGVLRTVQTSTGAVQYAAGPNADQFRQETAV